MIPIFKKIVLILPILAHFLVAHGTLGRTFIPESLFAIIVAMVIIAPFVAGRSRPVLSRNPFSTVLLPFIIYFCALNPIYSIYRGNNPDTILMISSAFLLIPVFVAVLHIYSFNDNDIKRFLYYFIALGLIVSFQVILVSLGGGYGDTGRATGIADVEGSQYTLTLPHLPIALAASLPLAFAHPNSAIRRRFLLILPIIATAIAMTVTRAMVIAVILSGLFSWFVVIYLTKIRILRSASDLGLIFSLGIVSLIISYEGVLALIDAVFERSTVGSSEDVNTILGRFDEYSAALEGFVSSPLIGQGIGNRFWFSSEYDLALSTLGTPSPHSHFFFILGATGIIGLILYYSLIASSALKLTNYFRFNRDDSQELIVTRLAIQSGFLAGFIFTLSSTTFLTLGYSIFFAAFIYTSLLVQK